MSVIFGTGVTVISSFWTTFKTTVTSKNLPIQYIDDGITTSVFAFDGPSLAYSAIMWDGGNVPPDLQSVYSVAQNNSDLTDFTTNFQSGANKRISRTDNFGNPITTEINFAAAFGLLPNVVSNRAQGYTATSATSGKVIRATTYTPQGTNAQRSVNSTSASDTSAGTGARTVTINYLDTSFVAHSETVTLNGTTAVNTVGTNIAFIENIVVASVGSGGGNVGTI